MFAEGQGRRSVAIGVVAFRLRAMKERRYSVREERERGREGGEKGTRAEIRVGGLGVIKEVTD